MVRRSYKVSVENKRLLYHKPSYSGAYYYSSIAKQPPKRSKKKKQPQTSSETLEFLPGEQNSYNGRLPLKAEIYRDFLLFHLTKFLENPEARVFYENLTSKALPEDRGESYIDDSSIDAEAITPPWVKKFIMRTQIHQVPLQIGSS